MNGGRFRHRAEENRIVGDRAMASRMNLKKRLTRESR